jgi:diacylglycerol kinase (ATP)
MARAVVIINPLSGRGRLDTHLRAHADLATTVLRRHGFEPMIKVTTGRGDALAFAAEAVDTGADLVVAWGGDGTVNEAACSLIHRDVPLAIVPSGSGNGLASDLGIPFAPAAALDIAATGRDFTIDAGQIHETLFFNIAGIGADAVIAARFAERGLRKRGPLAYLRIGVAELIRPRTTRYEICIDQERSEYHALMLALANGRQYGNRVYIAPGARLDDGLLELVVVEQLSALSIAMRLPSVFLGRLRPGRGVTMRAVRELNVRADAEIPFHADGEPGRGPSELTVRTLERVLRVRAPR